MSSIRYEGQKSQGEVGGSWWEVGEIERIDT